MREALQFQPIYQQRVWGGRRLETFLARPLPPGPPIGESWELVDRPEAQSRVLGGTHAGRTLRELIAGHAAELMGPGWDPARPFPLLIKWLDCSERLSLQVHPPKEVAPSLGGEAKTENWFVAQAAPGAALYVGLKPATERGAFARALAAQTAGELVNRIPVSAGDSVLVHSGQVHAIDAGNLILEIQQNSDTTYRLYDWGRVGLDGKPRQLHVEQSLESIRWSEPPPMLVRASPVSEVIAECDEFRIRREVLEVGETIRFAAGEQPRLLSIAVGSVCEVEAGAAAILKHGANVLLPYAAALEFQAPERAVLLVTDHFA